MENMNKSACGDAQDMEVPVLLIFLQLVQLTVISLDEVSLIRV